MYGTFDWNTVGGKNFLTTHLVAQAFVTATEKKKPTKTPQARTRAKEIKKGDGFQTDYASGIEEHRRKLKKRGFPLAAEHVPPIGQAALWYEEVIHYVPRTGRDVARQLARLAGEDSVITIPDRSLADAVGKVNSAGNLNSYMERGVKVLIDFGWIRKEVTGAGCAARTTYYLQVGEPDTQHTWTDRESDYEDDLT
ncbi:MULTISPECIES: hypothetical protein [unclassified Streptomyces]|uniref:hypothetical protein n=1 Tax=unclassified Streptomyces TaxID=2593676 RepID=UPI0036E0FBFF